MCWYFKTYMSKPPLKQTSGSNNLNSATSVVNWCWRHTRVWSSSRERSSLLPSRCNNTNFSACFDWDLRDGNATVTAKLFKLRYPPALNHRPVSNLDLLSLSNTLCTGYFEPPMNIPHVQLGNTSSKKWYVNDYNQILILEHEAPTLLLHWKTSVSLALPYLVDEQSLAHYLWVGLSWYGV